MYVHAGILSGRVTNDSAAPRDSSHARSRPSTSGGGSNCSAFGTTPDLRSCTSELLVGGMDVRRSTRLLNCYLPRNAAAGACDTHQQQQPQQQQPDPVGRRYPQQQSGWQSILQLAAPKQQQPQQTAPSRLQQQAPKQPQPQPEEVVRALQMQKLQVGASA